MAEQVVAESLSDVKNAGRRIVPYAWDLPKPSRADELWAKRHLRDYDLFHVVRRGLQNERKRAIGKLVERNARLAYSVAHRVCVKHLPTMIRNPAIDVEDVNQAALIGLTKAVWRFDYTNRCTFATYAVHWIHQGSISTILDEECVCIPRQWRDVQNAVRIAYSVFRAQHGDFPTVEQVAKMSGLSVEHVERAMQTIRQWSHAIPFGQPVGEDDQAFEDNLHLQVQDNEELVKSGMVRAVDSPDELFETCEYKELALKLFNTLADKAELDQRARDILLMRSGVGFVDSMTLEEVGLVFGVTRERIRQIEACAKRELIRVSNELQGGAAV